jgi:excisionase family DNA binding protein
VVAGRRLDHLCVALDGVERIQAVSLHAQSGRVMIIVANSATEMILTPRWYTVAQVAQLLNYGESKVRMLIITGQLRSIKDGRSRRILPEWVEAYVQDRAKAAEDIW